LRIFRDGSDVVFQELNRQGRPKEAHQFAEAYLASHPSDRTLIDLYGTECTRLQDVDRLERYLSVGLSNRPVSIEWHRWYQRLHPGAQELSNLIARYDDFLRADPENSALLYLRGRIDPDPAAQRVFFERSANRDPRNPFPFYALGYDALAAGDWLAARPHLAQAVKYAPDDYIFSHALFVTRLALGEAAALAQEARAQLRQNPLQVPLELQLIQALVAQGLAPEALRESSDFERRFMARHGRAAKPATDLVRREALYATGDFAGLENSARADSSANGRFNLLVALVEQGRVGEALAVPLPAEASDDKPFWLLALSMAVLHSGDTNVAADWRAKASAAMCEAGSESARAAPLLSRATSPTMAAIQGLALPPEPKAILLATLWQLHPQSVELAAAARRFNVDRRFPYHLIQRVTAGAAPPVEVQ
jgi:tetratricopeptide (TPR) repeat protein